MKTVIIPLVLLLAGCTCPDRIADGDGDQFAGCEVADLVALLGDPAPDSRSIRSAVSDAASTAQYIANPVEWDPWEQRWMAVLSEIQVKAAGSAKAERAHVLQLTIEQCRSMPELREISASEILPALVALEEDAG